MMAIDIDRLGLLDQLRAADGATPPDLMRQAAVLIEELAAALEPFALEAGFQSPNAPDGWKATPFALTLGDLRRAADLLVSLKREV